MALLDTVISTTAVETATARGLSALDLKAFIRAAVWQLFDATSNQSFKFHVGFVPVSIKVAKIEPLIIQWVGPRV